MKVLLLGYGKEGKAAEKYFSSHFDAEIEKLEGLTPAEFAKRDYSSYDIILRSPSVPPTGVKNESSLTRHFFDHCPCPIIGVTATKGKGTTCSFIQSLLLAHGADAHLVGNIGVPAIEILDDLTAESVVVYEMSSFQLWDLKKSPSVAVVGVLEPDHLNVHKDYAEYISAKANITRYQAPDNYLVYNQNNPEAVNVAKLSQAKKVPYPFAIPEEVAEAVKIPGQHNIDNAIAAIAAVASYLNISPDEYLRERKDEIIAGLASFKGLPHRLEFIREANGVKYYDDNFATNAASMKVAVEAFPGSDLAVIIGGRDKTENADLPEIYEILGRENIKKIILMGESGYELAKRYDDPRFIVVESLPDAVATAKTEAEKLKSPVVLMSPAAASFDMFKDVYDRGAQYQKLIQSL